MPVVRDRYFVTPSCPSTLALERFASGEVTRADLKAHIAGCAKCNARLDEMGGQLSEFSGSSASLDARSAFRRADQRWKRRAMLVALIPIAAAAGLAAAPFVFVREAPAPRVASVTPAQPPVQGRAVQVLEPRGTLPVQRLRDISVRGRPIAFGEGVLEGSPDASQPSRPFVLKHTDVRATV